MSNNYDISADYGNINLGLREPLEFHLEPNMYLIILNYLFELAYKGKTDSEIKISLMDAIKSYSFPIRKVPTAYHYPEMNMYFFEDFLTFAFITYKDEKYSLTFKNAYSEDSLHDPTIHETFLWIEGKTSKAVELMSLFKVLKSKSLTNSSLSNKIIQFTWTIKGYDYFIRNLGIIDPVNTELGSLFLPTSKKEQIKRFIYSINNYSERTIPLRYLFSGKPGTGKTQIIRTILSATKGNVTVLFCKGGSLPLQDVFDFCTMFKPCLLIIDDVDFIAGDRQENENKNQLSTFLQILDGVLPKSIFILASTNDKKLVDDAASRPGRFDLVLDIGEIESENYFSLIKRETDDVNIISFFNEEIINELRQKKVTGAYIVSLIKQLKSAKEMNGKLSKDDFIEYLNLTHNGFYAHNDESYSKSFGFN